jgi:hypothetical protein
MNGLKIALFFFVPLALISLFVPVMTNPAPKDCNNYPDGSGGYYLKCKDEYVSMIKKWKIEKEIEKTSKTNQ